MAARLAVRALALLTLAYLALPLVVVIGGSLTETKFLSFPPQGLTLDWYRVVLHDPTYVRSFLTSAVLALAATLFALVIGLPAAIAIARHSFRGKGLLSALLLSPLVLPHIVIGAALLQYGSAIGLVRNFPALLVGHVVIVTPFVLRTLLPHFSPGQRALEEASRDLGASACTTFRLVTLPLIRPGLVSGAIFAFITSFINVELSIFNTTAALNTIPVQLFNYVQYSVDPSIAAVSALTILAAAVGIVLIDLLIGLDLLPDK